VDQVILRGEGSRIRRFNPDLTAARSSNLFFAWSLMDLVQQNRHRTMKVTSSGQMVIPVC
jgi:hypothetical protein